MSQNLNAGFDPIRRLTLHLVSWVVFVVVVLMSGVAALAYKHATTPVTQEIGKKADAVARNVSATLEHAQQLGFDTSRMPGISERIGEMQRDIPGIAAITVQTGDVVHRAGEEGFLAAAERTASASNQITVAARADPTFARKVVIELAIDFAFILVAVVFITLELTYALLGRSLLQPVGQLVKRLREAANAEHVSIHVPSVLQRHLPRLTVAVGAAAAATVGNANPIQARSAPKASEGDDQTVDVTLRGLRLPFFLILCAEDLSRSFLPALSSNLTSSFGQLNPAIAAGLPLAVFMLCVALAQPLLSRWIDRFGHLRVLSLSAALAACSHGLTAMQSDLLAMTLCRGASGVAWALAFMVVQSEILMHTNARTRLPTLGIFVTVIMVSLVCAPQLGGMLADAYGVTTALGVASLLCLAALGLCQSAHATAKRRSATTIASPMPAPNQGAASGAGNLPWTLLKNAQFVSLIVLSAMPAKLLLVGYCFYFAPIAAAQAGYSSAMAGRLMMLYGLLMILCMPGVTALTQYIGRRLASGAHHLLVSAGMILSGIAGALLIGVGGMLGAGVAMALLGIAQALSTTPQATAIQQAAEREIAQHGNNAVFAYYRLLERTGSALGPLAFGALIAAWGADGAVKGIAAASLLCGCALLGITFIKAAASAVPARGAR